MGHITTPLTVLLLGYLWARDAHYAGAMSFFEESGAEYVDTVAVSDVTPMAARSRRSLSSFSDMPDHLHLDLHTGSHNVALRLRRSQHIHVGKVLVFTVGDDQKLVPAKLPDVTDVGVYRDIGHGAAFMVRRPHGIGAKFHLHGTLHINQRLHTLHPAPSSPPLHSPPPPSPSQEEDLANPAVLHVLRVVNNDPSYGQDYVDPEPEDADKRGGSDVSGSRDRRKRQTKTMVENEVKVRGKHNIDINIVCDYACYKRFYERHGNNETRALEEARLYFSYLAQSVDVRFRSISDVNRDVTITVTPINIITAKTPGGSNYSEKNRVNDSSSGVNGNALLTAFRTWVSDTKLPRAATTVLQTGYNMMTNGKKDRSGQLGIGYRGGACGYSGVVVVEEKFHGITGMVMAHEMGHNLNAKHDGAYQSSDKGCVGDSARYVMSTYIGVPQGSSKPWTFSSCSADSIAKFITNKRASCFGDTYDQIVSGDAGQVYDADEQCAVAFGAGSYFCRGRQRKSSVGFKGMCTKMYCSTTSAVDNTCAPVIPFEYTSCGHRMWCEEGQCVFDERAPSRIKNSCPQGDDPSYGCTRASCLTSLERDVFCCQTCSRIPFFPLAPDVTIGKGSRGTTSLNSATSSKLVTSSKSKDDSKNNMGRKPVDAPPLPPARLSGPSRPGARGGELMQRPSSLLTATTTSTVPPPVTVTPAIPTAQPPTRGQVVRTIFIPSVCRLNRFLCAFCLRTNYAYPFCRI